MSTGDAKPKKADVAATKSPFAGTRDSTFSNPFVSAESGIKNFNYTNEQNGRTYAGQGFDTTATLSDELQRSADISQSGLANNLAFLQQDPNERIETFNSGGDPLFNILQEQQNKLISQQQGAARVNASLGGNLNSTALGSQMGQIDFNDSLRRNQILLEALNYGNTQAVNNAGLFGNTISSLNELTQAPAGLTNNNLFTALGAEGSALAQTAAAQNAANMQYTSALNQYNQANQGALGSSVGSMIGGGLALAAAPFTGGASLAFAPALSNLGGSLGGSISGGNPASSAGTPPISADAQLLSQGFTSLGGL